VIDAGTAGDRFARQCVISARPLSGDSGAIIGMHAAAFVLGVAN
jgi:hypothetical protein